jgi:hypothetical protein
MVQPFSGGQLAVIRLAMPEDLPDGRGPQPSVHGARVAQAAGGAQAVAGELPNDDGESSGDENRPGRRTRQAEQAAEVKKSSRRAGERRVCRVVTSTRAATASPVAVTRRAAWSSWLLTWLASVRGRPGLVAGVDGAGGRSAGPSGPPVRCLAAVNKRRAHFRPTCWPGADPSSLALGLLQACRSQCRLAHPRRAGDHNPGRAATAAASSDSSDISLPRPPTANSPHAKWTETVTLHYCTLTRDADRWRPSVNSANCTGDLEDVDRHRIPSETAAARERSGLGSHAPAGQYQWLNRRTAGTQPAAATNAVTM